MVLCASVALHGGVASLIFWKVRATTVHTFDEAHQTLRFPGLQMVPWMILLGPTVAALAASLATAVTAGSVFLSLLAGGLVVAAPVVVVARVCVHVRSCEEVVRISKQVPGPQWYARLRHWLFRAVEAWDRLGDAVVGAGSCCDGDVPSSIASPPQAREGAAPRGRRFVTVVRWRRRSTSRRRGAAAGAGGDTAETAGGGGAGVVAVEMLPMRGRGVV